jgi:stage III sporulation protein AG
MKDNTTEKKKKALDALLKNKYALIVVAVGMLLLLIPTGGSGGAGRLPPQTHDETMGFLIHEQERRMSEALSQIEGAGKVTVILALKSSVEQAPPKHIYPEYLGALVVAQGADNATVRLELLRAVASLTGLGTDRITVTKMKIS